MKALDDRITKRADKILAAARVRPMADKDRSWLLMLSDQLKRIRFAVDRALVRDERYDRGR